MIGLELDLRNIALKESINFNSELKFDIMFDSLVNNGFNSVLLIFENEEIIEDFTQFKTRFF